MTDLTSVVSITSIGVGIQIISDISDGQQTKIFSHAVAGGVLIGLLSLVDMANPELAFAIAGLFTLTRFIAHSDPVIRLINALTSI